MFKFGIVSVTNTSLPARCASIMATAEGMRTIGASGGPFFPHATKATKHPHTITLEDHQDVFGTLKITGNQILLRDLRVGPPFRRTGPVRSSYSTAAACSAATG